MNKRTSHVTITIPTKLRHRMTKFQQKKKVNWSEIAAKAFRSYMKRKEKNVQEKETEIKPLT